MYLMSKLNDKLTTIHYNSVMIYLLENTKFVKNSKFGRVKASILIKTTFVYMISNKNYHLFFSLTTVNIYSILNTKSEFFI